MKTPAVVNAETTDEYSMETTLREATTSSESDDMVVESKPVHIISSLVSYFDGLHAQFQSSREAS